MVDLDIPAPCNDEAMGQCTFELNNDNVTELAIALLQLEPLLLGLPCNKDTCATTVACLLQIAVHCLDLQKLEIHSNTTNIVDDFKSTSQSSRFRELCSLTGCMLRRLDMHRIPVIIIKSEYGVVVHGMTSIFPSLEILISYSEIWHLVNLSGGTAESQEM